MKTAMLETKISQERKNNAINQKSQNILKSKNRKEKAMVEITHDLCKECGVCVVVCPVNALRISENLNIMGYHSVEFSKKLLTEAKVSVTPGIAFGPTGEGYIRLLFCVPEEMINKAFDRIEKYFK